MKVALDSLARVYYMTGFSRCALKLNKKKIEIVSIWLNVRYL